MDPLVAAGEELDEFVDGICRSDAAHLLAFIPKTAAAAGIGRDTLWPWLGSFFTVAGHNHPIIHLVAAFLHRIPFCNRWKVRRAPSDFQRPRTPAEGRPCCPSGSHRRAHSSEKSHPHGNNIIPLTMRPPLLFPRVRPGVRSINSAKTLPLTSSSPFPFAHVLKSASSKPGAHERVMSSRSQRSASTRLCVSASIVRTARLGCAGTSTRFAGRSVC